MRNTEKNNKGFTLIELIVSVVILGIVVVPIISLFLTSARLTMRSREIATATRIGTDIGEQIETLNFSEPLPALRTHSNTYSGENLQPDPATSDNKKYLVLNGAIDTTEDLEALSRLKDGDNIYYLGYDSISTEVGVFDAVVKIDPKNGKDAVVGGAGATKYNKLNSVEIPEYSSMDYMFMHKRSDIDVAAWAHFVTEAKAKGYFRTEPKIEAPGLIAKREIFIDIDETKAQGVAQNQKVEVSVTFKYSYQYMGYDEIVYETEKRLLTPDGGVENDPSKPYPAFYVLFDPWFGDGGDKIYINNPKNSPNTIVLAKQDESAGAATDELNKLKSAEETYQATVVLQEGSMPSFGIDDEWRADGATVLSNIDQEFYTTNPIDFNFLVRKGSSFLTKGDELDSDNLMNKVVKERIFEVTVEVYKRPDDATVPNYNEKPEYTYTTTNLQ